MRPSLGSSLTLKPKLRGLGLVAERPRHRLDDIGEADFLRFHRDGAGFDLGEVENVADQVEQVGAGAVNGAGEIHLLERQILVGIVRQLLAQDQDRVQRRAQLVAHVGQEFRLVFGGQRQFAGLFLQGAAGLFDFLVLALHFDILLGQLARLLFQLFVGLLQFLLLGLQLAGQLSGTA